MANLPEIEFRPVTIDEGDQFVSLMNRTYGRKKTIEYFKWQFFESPLETVLMGAFIKERLIGGFGLQCRKLSNGLTGGQAMDLIMDEEFRGKGIFSELGKAAMGHFGDSVDFCFSFPNPYGKQALCGSSGFRNITVIKTLMLSTEKLKSERKPGEIIETWDDPAIRDNGKAEGRGLYFLRDWGELKWRFGDNPDYKYTIIKIANDAYAVAKIFVDPVTQEHFGDIVDFGYKEEDDNLLENLFYSAVDYLIEQAVNKVTCWPSSGNLFKVLNRIGFVETTQERYFCVNPLPSGRDYLYNASKWFLVEADAEIY